MGRERLSSRGFLEPEEQFLFPCTAISINYRIVSDNGTEGGSPGQAAAVLQSLVLTVLVGLCREPAFGVCSCGYKEDKQNERSL